MLKDRFTRGLTAGVIAGVTTKAYDLLAFYFGLSKLRWLDFAGVMIFGRKPLNIWEQVFATLGTWFFHGMLGIIFVYLIERLFSSDMLLLKGWFFGVAVWFLIYAAAQLFKVQELSFIPLKTSISNFVGASLWGLLLAVILQKISRKG